MVSDQLNLTICLCIEIHETSTGKFQKTHIYSGQIEALNHLPHHLRFRNEESDDESIDRFEKKITESLLQSN